jgi:hypothetical protein
VHHCRTHHCFEEKKSGKIFKKLVDELDVNIQSYGTKSYSESVLLSTIACTSPTVQSDLSRRKSSEQSRDVSSSGTFLKNPVTQLCSSDVTKNNARLNKLFRAVFLY